MIRTIYTISDDQGGAFEEVTIQIDEDGLEFTQQNDTILMDPDSIDDLIEVLRSLKTFNAEGK